MYKKEEQINMFEHNSYSPLANRLRPSTLDDYIGQSHILGQGKILRQLIEKDQVPSIIFWGPPGVGKTTLARIIANKTNSEFIEFSAVTSGIKEVREIMKKADENKLYGKRTMIFIDEIHRFNKSQQDAFLPFVESGAITLIGSTTENPSFEINSALLSRCKVFILKALNDEEMVQLLKRALESDNGFKKLNVNIDVEHLYWISQFSNGDARTALNTLEMLVLNSSKDENGKIYITKEDLEQALNKKSFLYDKKGEEHYNLISALHKSMRNSDPDAALYYLVRMLEAGEEPLYIARRLVRFASEDIGIADSNALRITIDSYQACHFLGMPECGVNLAHAVVYLSMTAKSNSIYAAYNLIKEDLRKNKIYPVPMHIRNAPTKLMKDLAYGEGYQYAHDTKEKITKMSCLPDELKGKRYYFPTEQGREKSVKERLMQILNWKNNK